MDLKRKKDHRRVNPAKTPDRKKDPLQKRMAEVRRENLQLRKRIAEAKRAEKALERKVTELNSFINNIPDLAWVKDSKSRFVAVNRTFAETVGISPEILLNQTCEACFGREQARKFREDDQRVMKGRKQIIVEEQIVDSQSRTISLETVKSPIFDSRGRVVGTVGIARDQGGRKWAEEALRQSEQRYKNLYHMVRLMCDNVPDLIWAKDMEKRFLFINRAMGEQFLHVKDTDEPIGKTDMYFAEKERGDRPEDPSWHTFGEICTNSDAVVMEERKAGRFDEFGNIRGRFLYLDVHKAPFWDERGSMIGTVGCGRDVTREKRLEEERRKAEEALRESEKRYHGFFENAATATLIVEKDMTISMANAECEKMAGFPRRGMRGARWSQFVDAEHLERLLEYRRQRRRKKAPSEFEFRMQDRAGHWKDIFMKVGPIPGTGQVVCSLVDITARKRAEEEVRQFPGRLIGALEEERKRIARDLHDECGKALTVLPLELDTLKNSLPPGLDAEKTRIESLIHLAGQQADAIRRIASDLRPDMLDDIGLLPTLEWYVQDLMSRIGGIQISLQAVGIKKRLPPEVEIAMYRLIQEGLTNVVKHARARQVEIVLTLSYPKVLLVMRDDGVGFEEQAVLSDGKLAGGIGFLGMRERVRSLGGDLKIRSFKGKGTVIRAELPIRERGKNEQSPGPAGR